MLTSRLERAYNSNNNAPTHAPGFQIDYPPPPTAKVVRSPNSVHPHSNSSNPSGPPLGKEVPPPLPPKMFMHQNPLAGSNKDLSNLSHHNQHVQFSSPHHHPGLMMLPGGGNKPSGRMGMVTGSGFVLGKMGTILENPGGSGNGGEGGGHKQDVSGTWAGGLSPLEFKASSLLDSHDRFKPERSQRRLVQRMKWSSQSRWGRSLAGDLFSYSMGPPTPLDQEMSLTSGGFSPQTNNTGGGGGGHPSYYGHVSLPPLPVESESRVSSMTIADVSPRLALKKVLLLYEHAQYREAAAFINRVSVGTFRIILRELPMDVFVEAMPHSLPILEALYAKIYTAEGPRVDLQLLKPEPVVMHMVKFYSREDGNATQPNRMRKDSTGPFTQGCRKILGVIMVSEPALLKRLKERAKILDKIVEGMGQHGLVGTMDESLMPLHDALKLEFQRVVETYKGALQKLEELSLSNKSNPKNVAKGPAPVSASHQRQLSLRAEEIQERLIKNKSILNAVEPTLDNNCLDILLGILQRRVEVDKEALFQFTQLRKETGDANVSNSEAAVVAPILMRFSRGCKQVLELMREVGKEVGAYDDDGDADSSDLSGGYHSDSDSAIMTSGNSPFVTPRARYNFLSRSVRSKQGFRPSLMNSTWAGGNLRQLGKISSGPGSSKSFGGSSLDSSISGCGGGSPDELMGVRRHGLNPSHAVTPIRPRHVKNKNQLHKNNSLGKVSTASTDSSTSGCGASLTPSEEDGSVGSNSPQLPGGDATTGDCVECITVVSVPDNQVITQGMNHRCAKIGHGQNQTSPTSSTTSASTTNTEAGGDFVHDLRSEIALLKRQLQSANSTIYHMQEKARGQTVGVGGGQVNGGLLRKVQTEPEGQNKSDRRAELVREYGSLYAQARVDTMDALDSLPELVEADELKSKLLFSVVVLAFRSVQTRLAEIKEQVSNLLQFENLHSSQTNQDELLQPCQGKLVEALSDYLLSSQQKFDQSRCIEHVASQLWTTLYDYPCLRKCEGLLTYIGKCVNLAWRLSNQTPPCVLDYETRAFSRNTHVRFHSSDQSCEIIKTYLWPALIEGGNGICIHKGVVIT